MISILSHAIQTNTFFAYENIPDNVKISFSIQSLYTKLENYNTDC